MKDRMIPLSGMHLAMVHRLGYEPTPDYVDVEKGAPSPPVCDRLARLARTDPERARELAAELGYGNDPVVTNAYEVPLKWLLSMLSKGATQVGG